MIRQSTIDQRLEHKLLERESRRGRRPPRAPPSTPMAATSEDPSPYDLYSPFLGHGSSAGAVAESEVASLVFDSTRPSPHNSSTSTLPVSGWVNVGARATPLADTPESAEVIVEAEDLHLHLAPVQMLNLMSGGGLPGPGRRPPRPPHLLPHGPPRRLRWRSFQAL